MSARPTIAEERWLAVAARLRGVLPRGALDARAGGWKTTGPIVRIALFAAGALGAVMVAGIVTLGAAGGGRDTLTFSLIVAGLLAVGGAEAGIRGTRSFQGGVAEGAYAAGAVLLTIGAGARLFGGGDENGAWLLAAIGLTAAGLRVANSVVSTGGLALACGWLGTTAVGAAVDRLLGAAAASTLAGCALATAALLAGGRMYARPSTDRALDAIVAALPALALVIGAPFAARTFVDALVEARAPATLAIAPLAYAALAATLGLRRRRHAPLYGAMVAGVLGLALLRRALGGPDEAWLVAVGLASLIAAVALERRLRDARAGVTSAKLSEREGFGDLVQLAGVATLRGAHAPAPSDAPPPAVEGGGGRYGGGGASGSF